MKKVQYKLQDFQLQRELGTGAQSFVKLALHIPTQQLVALKVLSKHFYEKRQQVSYAFNEKKLLPCASPFAVEYLGSFQTENFAYLVLEYVKGVELFEFLHLSTYGLSLSLTRFISAQIVLFLETLHEQKIIYCDLKPENVMVLPNGYVKMVDFGMTSRLNRHGQKLTACGTLSYFCPNKLQHKPYDIRSDWWSLGILLHEMITNSVLFSGPDHEHVLPKVMAHKITYPKTSDVDDSLKKLIKNLLHLDPAKRLNVTQIKAHPFYAEINWAKLATKNIDIKSQSLIHLIQQHKNQKKSPSPLPHSSKSSDIWHRW